MIATLQPSAARLICTLAVGIGAVSFGSILVRYAQEASSPAIAFHRLFWSVVILAPFYLVTGRRGVSWRTNWKLQTGAAAALALHFAFWIASLRYTSVAVSVLLVNTAPVFVALLARFLGTERLTVRGATGLMLAFLGTATLLYRDLVLGAGVAGPALALAGAVMYALYFLIGRSIRQTTDLLSYVFPTYLLAGLVMGVLCWIGSGPPIGFSFRTYGFLFLLGLVPQCIGHTAQNWALRFLPATLVSTLLLGEPVVATLLAWWLLNEPVGPVLVAGGALAAAGILLVSNRGVTVLGDQPSERDG